MTDSPTIPGFEQSGLGMLVAAARRAIKHAVAPLLDPLDLTPHQGWMILLLRETGPLSLTELALRMWLDHPTTSRLVHSLEARQILEVNQDPNHGRRIQIGISSQGASMSETLFMASETFRLRMEKGFTPEEKDAFRRSLHKLLFNLSEISTDGPKRKGKTKGHDLDLD